MGSVDDPKGKRGSSSSVDVEGVGMNSIDDRPSISQPAWFPKEANSIGDTGKAEGRWNHAGGQMGQGRVEEA